VMAINLAATPDGGAPTLGLATVAFAAGTAFIVRQRRARAPLYDLHVAARRIFWVAATAGSIVFGALMGAMFVGQQFLQNVLGYSTLEAGLAILPGVVLMVLTAPNSARLVNNARGARVTLLTGYAFCLLGFLTMLVLWKEGVDRGRVRRHASLPFADGIRAGRPCRNGVGDRGSAARSRRGNHAVDPRRAAHGELCRRLRGSHRKCIGRGQAPDHGQHRPPIAEIVRGRRRHCATLSALCGPDNRSGEVGVPVRRSVSIHSWDYRDPARRRARLLSLSEEGRGGAAARAVSLGGHLAPSRIRPFGSVIPLPGHRRSVCKMPAKQPEQPKEPNRRPPEPEPV